MYLLLGMYSASLGRRAGPSNLVCCLSAAAQGSLSLTRSNQGGFVDPALSFLLFLSQNGIWLLTLFDPAATAAHIMPLDVSEELRKHTAIDIIIWPTLTFFQVCLPGYKG